MSERFLAVLIRQLRMEASKAPGCLRSFPAGLVRI